MKIGKTNVTSRTLGIITKMQYIFYFPKWWCANLKTSNVFIYCATAFRRGGFFGWVKTERSEAKCGVAKWVVHMVGMWGSWFVGKYW
jgi:hypothetical protein